MGCCRAIWFGGSLTCGRARSRPPSNRARSSRTRICGQRRNGSGLRSSRRTATTPMPRRSLGHRLAWSDSRSSTTEPRRPSSTFASTPPRSRSSRGRAIAISRSETGRLDGRSRGLITCPDWDDGPLDLPRIVANLKSLWPTIEMSATSRPDPCPRDRTRLASRDLCPSCCSGS